MTTDPYAWRVHIADEWSLGPDMQRVIIYRHHGEVNEAIVQATPTDRPEVKSYPTATVNDEPVGLLLPYEVVQAIAEKVKPGPAQGEVKRLEEALEVERRRVDELLAAARTSL